MLMVPGVANPVPPTWQGAGRAKRQINYFGSFRTTVHVGKAKDSVHGISAKQTGSRLREVKVFFLNSAVCS